MLKYLFLSILVVSCVRPITPDPNRFYQDDLFCWIKDKNGKWRSNGDPSNCPAGTVYK